MRLRVIAAALLVGGCTTPQPSAPPPAPVDPRALSHFTIVWSDPAGLDLLSAEGTYLRASVESLRLAAANSNRDAAYPGFWETLTGPAKDYAESFFALGPDDALHGVNRFEVIGVADHDDRLTAGLCIYERQLGVEDTDGRFTFNRMGSHYWELTVEKAGEASPPAGQRGRDTYPQAAMFGSWRTVKWSRQPADTPNPCAGRPTPGVEPGAWPALMPGSRPYVTEDVPTAPNYPGWLNNVT
ncbi:hypothetical protein AFM11_14630 [Mycolicibacterium wolinskyi]|uniref:Lipoprotein n=1 Tax=Mycolicibacterium wolinskyi TaxID=59750 RepID=A0A132PMG1_9MYCO|nr:hypothetical protein [Mycolicibacterium wolinskyi]KWX23505.1 hypothetical protein AFM11_14630 [Mycolicibacterium wolinskyi]